MSLKSMAFGAIDKRIAPRMLDDGYTYDNMGDDAPREPDRWTVDDFDDLLLEHPELHEG